MTQEEKEILIKDLLPRLPYGVIVLDDMGRTYKLELGTSYLIDLFYENGDYAEAPIRPYLRPISSMTEEEIFQLGRLTGAASYNMLKGDYSSLEELLKYVYKNHIDYFGLISRGLALEAPDDMYITK